jgi:hypothetical protein
MIRSVELESQQKVGHKPRAFAIINHQASLRARSPEAKVKSLQKRFKEVIRTLKIERPLAENSLRNQILREYKYKRFRRFSGERAAKMHVIDSYKIRHLFFAFVWEDSGILREVLGCRASLRIGSDVLAPCAYGLNCDFSDRLDFRHLMCVVFLSHKYSKDRFDQLETIVVIVGFSFHDLAQATQTSSIKEIRNGHNTLKTDTKRGLIHQSAEFKFMECLDTN